MTRYLFSRLLATLLTLLAASAVVFAVLEVLPGNAAQVLMGPDADAAAVAAKARELGLDRPAAARYAQWLGELLRGQMGLSYAYGTPVAALVAERLAVTVPLALAASALACALALAAGVCAAWQRGRWADAALMALSQAGMAVPGFWFAMLLVLLFAVKLQWFAAGGFAGWDFSRGALAGLLAGLRSLALPALALALVQAAALARFVRSCLLETLGEDYVRTARAKGLGERAVLWRHALRNALAPVLTVAAMQLAELLAGAIVMENVFSLPGLGRLMFQAIGNRDLAVVRNGVMLLVALVLLVNLAVDVAHALIDPRLTHARRLRAGGRG
ncbi:MAG: ABC transporter permease [Ottowia sp.]